MDTAEINQRYVELRGACLAHEHGDQFVAVAASRLNDGKSHRFNSRDFNIERLAAAGWTWEEVRMVNG